MFKDRVTVLLLVCILSTQGFASRNFDVYRMLQYDKGSTPLGCRRTSLNSPASTLTSVPTVGIKQNNTSIAYGGDSLSFSRSVVLIRLQDLLKNENRVNPIQALASRDDVTGVVVVLPEKSILFKEENSQLVQAFQKLERTLLSEEKAIEKPIYFTFENPELNNIHDHLLAEQNGEILPDTYQIVVDAPDATLISSISLTNIQGKLNGKGSNLPTVAIVAHYDTLSIVPELTRGLETNGSGAIALLELARLFQLLYASPQTRGAYNLLFVLTSGGRLNYEGARHWIQKLDHKTLDHLQFVLCLESLGSDQLFMHVAQKSTDENVIRLFREFTSTAATLNTTIEFSHKKIDVASREIAWEHEAFARKNIQSATLSKFVKPVPQITRSSAIDLKLDQQALKQNVKLIAEALGKFIYPIKVKDVEIFSGSLSISDRFMNAWVDTLSQYSRAIPFTTKNSNVVINLKNTLSQLSNDVTLQEFEPKTSTFKFYGNGEVQMSVYKVKPLSFDLLLLVPIVAYILGLHIWLVGFTTFKNNLLSIFQAPPPNKKK
jgi:hypothetical protein